MIGRPGCDVNILKCHNNNSPYNMNVICGGMTWLEVPGVYYWYESKQIHWTTPNMVEFRHCHGDKAKLQLLAPLFSRCQLWTRDKELYNCSHDSGLDTIKRWRSTSQPAGRDEATRHSFHSLPILSILTGLCGWVGHSLSVQYDTIRYGTIKYRMMWYNIVQYDAMSQ